MGYLHTAAIVLHIVFAGAWFGLAIGLSILTREAIKAESRGAAVASIALTKSMTASAALFVVFALTNFGLGAAIQGMGVYGWPYHAAIVLGIVLLGIQVGVVRPGVHTMRSNLGTPVGRNARSKVGMALGAGHALWFGMLLLMYVQRV